MSWLEDKLFDEWDEDQGFVGCKYCGADDCYWENDKGSWVLMQDGERHNCKRADPRKEFTAI